MNNQVQVKKDVQESIRQIAWGEFIKIDKAFEKAKNSYRKQSSK